MTLRFRSLASVLFALASPVALVACGGDTPTSDAGVDASEPDTGVDAGPPLTCTSATPLDGVLGDTVSVMFDTRMTEERPRDLGIDCGNPEGELRWAPQEVVEFHVPGSGRVAVLFDSSVSGTQSDFNTVIQVRRTCERVPEGIFPPTCFDDQSMTEFRARGAVDAMGGETLYFLVTGYSEPPAGMMTVDRGQVQVDFTVRANAPPTLTSGYLRLANDDVLIRAQGMDPDGNAAGVAMNFRRGGELLDIYGDGEATMNGDVFWVFFAPPPTGTTYDGRAIVLSTTVNLGPYLRAVEADEAIFRVFDAGWAVSDQITVPIEEAMLVGLGETCDDDHVCRLPMSCSTGGVCEVTGPARAVCEGGTVITIDPPTDTATTATVMGTTGAGVGQYRASCEVDATIGAERVYILGVPDGTFDLIASTDLPGTGATDTILYVRSSCPDSGTELACNDDIAAGNTHSRVQVNDVTMGVYYIFVERYGGLASGSLPHALQVTLRPVRASGETCDPAGTTSRCATGLTCSGTPATCT